MHGINVIPTICWSDRKSFEWCFDGEPTHGVVAVSSVGTQNSEEGKQRFLDGYFDMVERLQPAQIIFVAKSRMSVREILYISSSLVRSGMRRRWRSGREFAVLWWQRSQ